MKGSSNYLRNQVFKNLAKAIVSLLLFFIILGTIVLTVLFTFELNSLEIIGLLLSILPLITFFFYQHKYRVYSGGWAGEKQIINLLNDRLSDDFILLNDLYLRGGGGDIDHVIVGPSGVFVLETKNWNGKIICNGDEWQRTGKGDFKASPSRQVKRNVATIQKIIGHSSLKTLGIVTQGIVVFTNRHATLHLNNPTVLVIKMPQLPSLILSNKQLNRLTSNQIEDIAKEIVKYRR
jgi:hypothetical protein